MSPGTVDGASSVQTHCHRTTITDVARVPGKARMCIIIVVVVEAIDGLGP